MKIALILNILGTVCCRRHPDDRQNHGRRRRNHVSKLGLAVELAGGVDPLPGRHRPHGGCALTQAS